MKAIRSLIKEQNKNLIRPKFALICSYLFGILGQALPVGSIQDVDNIWITKAMSLAVIFTAGAQIICTIRAGFARPSTWLRKSAFMIILMPPFFHVISNCFIVCVFLLILFDVIQHINKVRCLSRNPIIASVRYGSDQSAWSTCINPQKSRDSLQLPQIFYVDKKR